MIGVQLYTLRHVLEDRSALEHTLRRLRDIGYEGVEPYPDLVDGVGAERFAELVRSCDLLLSAHHVDFRRLERDPTSAITECGELGCRWVVVTSMPKEYRTTEGTARFATRASHVARRLASEGLGLAYHNHRYEFDRDESGKSMFDVLWDRASGQLRALIDIGWVHAVDQDPAAWIGYLSGRVPIVHAKDVRSDGRSVQTVPIGDGGVNWDTVLAACQQSGVEWYVVEQDQCADDPFACVARSFRHLSTELSAV